MIKAVYTRTRQRRWRAQNHRLCHRRMATKWKNDRGQSKRELPATLQPLDYKPKAVEDIDTIQMTKVRHLPHFYRTRWLNNHCYAETQP